MGANEHNPISDYAATTIRCKARQLVGKAGFTSDDIEDIEQELRTDLLERLPKYDPDKAAQTTFVARIITRKISKMIRHRTAEMRDYRRESFSINEEIDDGQGEKTPRSDTIDDDEVEMRCGRRSNTRQEEMDLHLDLSLVMSRLPDDLRRIAESLLDVSVSETSRILGIPRSSIYDALDRMRPYFEDGRLEQYL
jgi:RNA polymerase sigma-70 factor (ECF subfamily)